MGAAFRGGYVVTRVIIVDDDAPVRTTVRDLLEEAGIDVVEAANGSAALRAVRDATPDVVLCDLFMPDVDGFELIRELRRDFPGVRIIAMSGGGFAGRVDLLSVARHLGAAEILQKPFSRKEILAAVARNLRPSSGGG
jgi:DNA-binding response OmpR family regulator